jgi:NADPH-dependent 7-cyano-7-deazaguanine reductase QueF
MTEPDYARAEIEYIRDEVLVILDLIDQWLDARDRQQTNEPRRTS